MATGKKQQKTNKTAHVLNLLAGDSGGQAEGAAPELQANAPLPQSKPNLSQDKADEQELQEQIKSALEEAFLMEELNQTTTQSQAEAPVPTDLPEMPLTGREEPEAAAPAAQPEMREAELPKSQTDPEQPEVQEKEFACVNVMQALVEGKIDKYIKLFGLCTCSRCRVDVMALALTNLPAKYVVIGEQERIPMLSVYEGRYNAAVVSQVMWACKKVMDNPRH